MLEARVGDADFVLHVGDLSYAVGHGHIWNDFGNQIAGIASVVPYMVSIGNHEYDYPGQPFAPPLFTYKISLSCTFLTHKFPPTHISFLSR